MMSNPPPAYDDVPDAPTYHLPPKKMNVVEPENNGDEGTSSETAEDTLEKHNRRMVYATGAFCWLTTQCIAPTSIAFFNQSAQEWFATDTARILAYCMIAVFWLPNFIILMIIYCSKDTQTRRNCIPAGIVFFILTFGALMTFMCGAFHAIGFMFGVISNLLFQIIMVLLYRFTDQKTFTRKKAAVIGLLINLVLAGVSFVPPYYIDNNDVFGAIPAPIITVLVGYALQRNAERVASCSKGKPCHSLYVAVVSCMELALVYNVVFMNFFRFLRIVTSKIV